VNVRNCFNPNAAVQCVGSFASGFCMAAGVNVVARNLHDAIISNQVGSSDIMLALGIATLLLGAHILPKNIQSSDFACLSAGVGSALAIATYLT